MKLIDLAKTAGYGDSVECLKSVFHDWKINKIEDLDNLPSLNAGRNRFCGKLDVYKFTADMREAAAKAVKEATAVPVAVPEATPSKPKIKKETTE